MHAIELVERRSYFWNFKAFGVSNQPATVRELQTFVITRRGHKDLSSVYRLTFPYQLNTS